jgi:DNA-binding CsgD family transcriptional regulator
MNAPVRGARHSLAGRAAELTSLDRLVDSAACGRGGIALLLGEQGIGKTTLTALALARAATLGCATARGAGDALTSSFPLLPVADALGTEPDGLTAGDVLALVRKRCAASPLVLAVEDMQWADEQTLLVWNRLARAVAGGELPLLLIGTARPWPHRASLDTLADLAARRAGTVLNLGPLSPAEIAGLAGQVLGGQPGPTVREVLSHAGGNPRYVRLMAGALRSEGLVVVAGGLAELAADDGRGPGSPCGQAMPSAVTTAIGRDLGFLPRRLRVALQTAALLGPEFSVAQWAAATGCDGPGIAEHTRDAASAGLLSGDGERLRFRHEVVRQALADEIPLGLRAAAHTEIARLLARGGTEADAVARHLLAGAANPEPWVAEWLARLPDADLYAQPAAFARLLPRAFAAVPENGELRESLVARCAQLLFWLGRDEEAATTAAGAAARTGDPAMLVLAVRAAVRLGRPEQALQVAAQFPLSPEQSSALWSARLTAWTAHALAAVSGPGEAEAMAKEALRLAMQSGDSLTIGYAWYALAECGDPATEAERLHAALSAIQGRDPESMETRVLLSARHLSAVTRQGGPAADAEAALAEALATGEDAGWARAGAIREAAATFCYRSGRWDEALAHLAAADGPVPPASQPGVAALIALRRGSRQDADTWLSGADSPASAGSADPLTRALALRAEADGDLTAATGLLRRWLGGPPADRSYDELPSLVRLALASGDRDTARDARDAAADDAADDPAPGRRATARFCTALLDDDAPGLLEAAEAYRFCGWLPLAAAAYEEAAARLGASGDTAGARAALTSGARIYSDCGAAWDTRRADARLRAFGVRRGPRSMHTRASAGWASLTPAELRVAALIAQGATNAGIAAELFLSPRTVHTHVSNILRKLGAASRVEVVREAAMQDAHAVAASGSLSPSVRASGAGQAVMPRSSASRPRRSLIPPGAPALAS